MTWDDQDRIVGRLRAYSPPLHFEPFEVVFHVMNGVSLSHPYINGDSLIARLLMRLVLGEDFYTLPSKAPINLPLNLRLPLKQSYDGVYHSSVSLFDTDHAYVEMIYKQPKARDIAVEGSRVTKIPLNRAFFKAGMIQLMYVPCNTVRFYMNGNRAECERLLRHVTHLGKDRGRGYGAVNKMNIRRLSNDYSLFRDGEVMRPIPIRFVQDLGMPSKAMNLNWYSPYWSSGHAEPCAQPPGVGLGEGSRFAAVVDDGVPVRDWYDGLGHA